MTKFWSRVSRDATWHPGICPKGLWLCPLPPCQPLSPTASCSLGSWDCSLLLLLFLSEYSCFTMLCWCLQYNKLNQLYVCIYPRPFEPPSHPSSHPSRSSETELRSLCYTAASCQLLHTWWCTWVNTSLPVHPAPLPTACNRPFSTSASLILLYK